MRIKKRELVATVFFFFKYYFPLENCILYDYWQKGKEIITKTFLYSCTHGTSNKTFNAIGASSTCSLLIQVSIYIYIYKAKLQVTALSTSLTELADFSLLFGINTYVTRITQATSTDLGTRTLRLNRMKCHERRTMCTRNGGVTQEGS